METKSKKHNIKVGVFTENDNTFLSLEYIEDNKKVQIHKIALDGIDVIKETLPMYTCNSTKMNTMMFGSYDIYNLNLPLLPVTEEQVIYTIIDLDYLPHEMSIKEIEKQLGYPIKIKGE